MDRKPCSSPSPIDHKIFAATLDQVHLFGMVYMQHQIHVSLSDLDVLNQRRLIRSDKVWSITYHQLMARFKSASAALEALQKWRLAKLKTFNFFVITVHIFQRA
jgi:hypothetical protein